MEEVLAFRRIFRSLNLRVGEPINLLCSTWINVAFSHGAVSRLVNPKDADAFGDQGIIHRVGVDPLHRPHQVLDLPGKRRVIPHLLLQAGQVAQGVADGAVPVGSVRTPADDGTYRALGRPC